MSSILIIEDDATIAKVYETYLLHEGYTITVIENGVDGLDRAIAKKPDLILLDIVIPRMNGIEVLEKLKHIPETSQIPVIVLTNMVGDKVKNEALSKGAVLCIMKDRYSPEDIVKLVKEHLLSKVN
jgi:CheY-like chemotaxis protein